MFISKRKREPAHYMLKIESFSLTSEAKTSKIESDVFEASGHKWRLDLYPCGNGVQKKDEHISLYVVMCDTKSCSGRWEVCVDVSFFVYDHIHHNYVSFQDGNGHRTQFHEKKTTWGFDKLISLDSFKDSKNGYLYNDSCVIGAEVFANPEFTQVDRCLSMTKPPATMNTYTWTINNFSAVTESLLCSDVFKVGKVKWKLSLYPKGNKTGKDTHLSIYLGVHNAASLPNDWKVYAEFKVWVKNQCIGSDIEIEANSWFCNSDKDRGFAQFMLLSELNDPKNGFLLSDNLTVEVVISLMGTFRHFI